MMVDVLRLTMTDGDRHSVRTRADRASLTGMMTTGAGPLLVTHITETLQIGAIMTGVTYLHHLPTLTHRMSMIDTLLFMITMLISLMFKMF